MASQQISPYVIIALHTPHGDGNKQRVSTCLPNATHACNLAAHTICSFKEMDISSKTGYPPTKMHEKIFRFLKDYTDIPLTDDSRQQYSRMNEKLISLL